MHKFAGAILMIAAARLATAATHQAAVEPENRSSAGADARGPINSGFRVEIPFEFRDGLIWVEVRTTRTAEPLKFLLDSGANVSVISLQTAQRLGLRLGARVTVRGVETRAEAYWPQRLAASAGAVTLPREYLAADLCELSATCHCPVDGLIGSDFFRERVVQVDFAGRVLRLLNSPASSATAVTLPLKWRRNAMRVPVGVNDASPQWVRLDTGCATALQWVDESARPAKARGAPAIGLAAGLPSCLATVQLGVMRFERVPTGFHRDEIFRGERGLLGNGLLARFSRVTIDSRAGRLVLEPR